MNYDTGPLTGKATYPAEDLPPVTPEIDRVAERLQIITETLINSVARLTETNAGLFGPRPEKDTSPSSFPIASGRLGELDGIIDRLDNIACQVGVQAQQIARL